MGSAAAGLLVDSRTTVSGRVVGWAGDAETGPGLSVTGKAMAGVCIGAVYAVPSIGLTWQPGLWGLGLEVRGLTNPAQPDFYLVPFLEGRIGWFFLGLGLDLPLVLGGGAASSSGPIPAATLGLDLPVVAMGPGKLGLSLSADAILTLISGASSGGTPIGDAFGTILLTLFGSAKMTAGLHYSVPL